MKRILAMSLLVCLLLCGCGTSGATPTEATDSPLQTEAPPATTVPAETVDTPEPTPSEPSEQETTVTVYLVEKVSLVDSGYTEYCYDEDHNIISYKVFSIENDLMYTGYFEELDSHGMAGKFRMLWEDDDEGEIHTLVWFEDGKLSEEQYSADFSGHQYEYNAKGDVTEKREYFEGILFATTYYEYDDSGLQRAYYTDADGLMWYEWLAENGRITEKICYEEDGTKAYTYQYTYDENGNLTQEMISYEEEIFLSSAYTYKAVEVTASRAQYIIRQQEYLLSLT